MKVNKIHHKNKLVIAVINNNSNRTKNNKNKNQPNNNYLQIISK